jgi:hypothetical protein
MGFKIARVRAWLAMPLLILAAGELQAVDLSSSTISSSTFTWRQAEKASLPEGENLRYVVKWGLVTAGYSTLAIQGVDQVNGRAAYHLVSEARSGGVVTAFYRVEDHNEAWLDRGSMSSVRYEKRIKEGKYHIEESTLIDQPAHRYHMRSYRIDKNLYEQKDGDIPQNVLDVLSSLYYVRLMPLEVGKSYTMDVLSGDKVYPLVVRVEKREIIKVPAGKFDTFCVEPLLRAPGIFVAKGKKLEVWLTADEHRIPVRMRSEVFIGHVSAELLPNLK